MRRQLGIVAAMAALVAVGYASPSDAQMRRQYYLTPTSSYNGANARSACAAGYHMASLFEILDPTDLDYNSTLGYNNADSGGGPPAGVNGWIRTGFVASPPSGTIQNPAAGWLNCTGYTSTGNYGTVVFLSTQWTTTAPRSGPWAGAYQTCTTSTKVWCVED